MTITKVMLLILCFAAVIGITGCTGTGEPLPAPELIRSPAAQVVTTSITRGDLVSVTRRSGVTRYMSEGLYFNNPIAGFGEYLVQSGDFVYEGQLLAILDTEVIDEQIENQDLLIANMRRDHAIDADLRQLDIDIMVLDHANRVNQAVYNQDQDAAEAIEAQTTNIDRAQLELRQLRERNSMQLHQAEARLQTLHDRRATAELRAPFDGEITNLRPLDFGQSVGIANPLVYITDRSQVVVEAVNKPFTQDWPQPGPGGMPPDPWRPNTVRGALEITAVIGGRSYEVEYIVLQLDERPFRPVRFTLTCDTRIPAGEYAAIHFYHQRVEDVLLIPDNAIFMSGAQPYVYLYVDGDLIYTEIRLQARTLLMSAIAEGLQEGDLVVIR